MRSTSRACSPFKRASMSLATSACGASAQWPRWTIPTFGATELGVDASAVGAAAAKVKREDYFVPAFGRGAEMLQAAREEIIEKLVELLKDKGGLK